MGTEAQHPARRLHPTTLQLMEQIRRLDARIAAIVDAEEGDPELDVHLGISRAGKNRPPELRVR